MKNCITNQPDLNEIFARLDKLTPDSKSLWGKMNVNQMLKHLSDAANFAFDKNAERKKPGFFNRKIMKWMIFNLSAPKNTKTFPSLDLVANGINPDNFNSEMEILKNIFQKIADGKEPRLANPFLGELTHEEWGRLCYVHANHHLKQFGV